MAHTDQYVTGNPSDYKFSASQITSWMRCRRYWGFTYLCNMRGAAGDAAAFGTRTHSQIEAYLNGGEIDYTTEEGAVAGTMLEHLPAPAHDLDVEAEFHILPSATRPGARHHWWGFKDVERAHEIWDNKTTSNINGRWVKTEETLKYDPQAVLYAKDNGSDPVHLNWVYGQSKKTKKSKVVHLKMAQAHAELGFECLEDAADEVYATVVGAVGIDAEPLQKYVLALPYNANECEAFGGCQFRSICNLSPQERFQAKMKQFAGGNHMSLFERMKEKNRVEDNTQASINPPESEEEAVQEEEAAALAKEKAAEAYKAELERVKKQDAARPKTEKKPKPEPKAAAAPSSTPATPPTTLTVWLDCTPFKAAGPIDCELAENLFAEAKKRIQSNLNLDDYRFAEFGQGPGILQQMVAQILDERILKISNLLVDTRLPEASACLALFKSRASSINIGVR